MEDVIVQIICEMDGTLSHLVDEFYVGLAGEEDE